MTKIAMIIAKFDASINEIDKLNHNQLISLNLKIKRTFKCLNDLRKEVKQNGFNSHKEEIYFFKNQKPYIKGRLQFYISLNEYLLDKPTGVKSQIRKYINLQLSKISNESCKYNGFRNYIKLEKSYKDKLYFLRVPNQLELLIEDTPFNNPNIFEDPNFCTSRDHLVAKIVKNDLLCKFYTNELEKFKIKKEKQIIQEIQNTQNLKIPWTGSNTELVESIKGLNAVGAIGNGNLSVKQMQDICINNFSVNPGNIYKVFEQIKARKSNPTKFLDKMTKALLNEIISEFKKP